MDKESTFNSPYISMSVILTDFRSFAWRLKNNTFLNLHVDGKMEFIEFGYIFMSFEIKFDEKYRIEKYILFVPVGGGEASVHNPNLNWK